MSNRSFYNEILTEHNMHPDFKHPLPDADLVLEGVNPTCGDDIFLRLKVDENDTIIDGAYDGDGCAISQASASLMIDDIIGKSEEEARRLIKLFFGMIKGEADGEELDDLEDAAALQGISHPPARVKCAVLAWHTLEEALDGKQPEEF